jgi:Protein of unknown function (DUF2891)
MGGDSDGGLLSGAGEFARVALANIAREFPHHEPLLQIEPGLVPRPRDLHPSFYGSFDWHSCVAMHWLLVRLLRVVPELVPVAEIRLVLNEHFAAERLATEASYFSDPARRTTERPYGWGWALRLMQELSNVARRRCPSMGGKPSASCRRLCRALSGVASEGHVPGSARRPCQ